MDETIEAWEGLQRAADENEASATQLTRQAAALEASMGRIRQALSSQTSRHTLLACCTTLWTMHVRR